MSPNTVEIRNRVAKVYPEAAPVAEDVLRFHKQTKAGVPFAVYYLDLAQGLPATEPDLRRYVERVIGSRYFDEARSLQWNNYLYFVRDTQELLAPSAVKAKRLIEGDREYARKFVIDESELGRVLQPSVVLPTEDVGQVDVASRWADVLKQPHLIEAVFGQHTLKDRKNLINGTEVPPEESRSNAITATSPSKLLPRLRHLRFDSYRQCLQGKEFDFADVNLLAGVNGSGKTSMLEAIELYYCGRTRRNPKVEERYRLTVVTEDGASETVSGRSHEQTYRDRARSWFGMNEPRNQPSGLCDAFGRFSFLNTDAAIDLARDDDANIEDDLARLLVGSEAAVTWQVIERLASEVATDLLREENRKSNIDQELKSIRDYLAAFDTIKKESESLRAALRAALQRNDWKADDQDLEAVAGFLVEQLSELRSVAQQGVELQWLESPVTLDICQEFVSAVHDVITAQKPQVERLQSLETHHVQLETERVRSDESVALLTELGRLVQAGVERRADEIAVQRAVVNQATSLMAGIDEQLLAVARAIPGSRPVAELQESAAQKRAQLEMSLREAKEASDKFANARDRSIALAQQLRRVATEIIGDSSANECPLCHTRFRPGELARNMAIGLDEQVEAAAQKLLADVAQLEKELREAEDLERLSSQIARFCVSAQLPDVVSLEGALSSIAETQAQLRDARSRVDALTSEEESLRASGLSRERMSAVRSKLNSLGQGGELRSIEDVTALRSTVEEKMRVTSVDMQSSAATMKQIRAAVQEAINPFGPSAVDLQKALAELETRRTRTEAIFSRLMQFLPRFGWSGSRPIAEWIVETETVANMAANLQMALGSERVAENRSPEMIRRKDDLEKEAKQVVVRMARLKEADNSFGEIKANHSLGIVTRTSMEKNRTAIEKIFSQIHTPAEFEGIEFNDKHWGVTRKGSAERVRLTQISTGQRAAFALSVFLALNAQLRTGLPVLLIDDPIAHVDDLNCLSFLDYLRDIALEDRRQIFFATASDKLASLFKRKFDFLGDQFRCLDLTLNTTP